MSIYGDAEGGQESLGSLSKSEENGGGGMQPSTKCLGQDLSDEKTRNKVGGGIAVVVVFVMLYAFASDFEWESGERVLPHPEVPGHTARPNTVGASGEIVFIPAGAARKLSAGMEHASVNVPLDYQIDFELVPGPNLVDDWSNIIHLTATGENCCDYGDRVPGVWFRPGTRQLDVIDGHGGLDHAGGSGNDECIDTTDLEAGRRYKISIQMRQKVVEVLVADCGSQASGQCTAELQLRCTEKREDRIVFPRAQVFASDTFYTPADATIDNFYMTSLEPVRGCTDFSACNHNAQASEDDDSCFRPTPGVDCAGQQNPRTQCPGAPPPPPPPPPPPYVPGAPPPPPPPPSCQKTQFISPASQVSLVKGHVLGAHEARYNYQPDRPQAFHAVVSLPLDYTVSFTITPGWQTQPDWASIVHFTATGNNCCAYGDRAPAVWFHPDSRKLHIVDGHPDDGNANCNPSDELPPNVPTTVTIDIGAGFYEVSVSQNGQTPRQVCEGLRQNRRSFSHVHVWAADPFYEPAFATISDFWMSGPNMPRAGCMIDAACNRDYKANRPDGSCIFPQPHTGCNQHPLVVDGNTGVTQFVPRGQLQRLQQNGFHDIVYMPENARISFQITPDSGVVSSASSSSGGWGSIFHFSATGGNCCEYGDRVPAVWFYPDSHRLHIVHGGAGDDGNNDCSPQEELQAGRPTTVQIDIRQTHVEVFYDGHSRCDEPRSGAHEWSPVHMYMSDPWHDPGLASISDFYLEHLDPLTGCTDPLACNYDERAAIDDQSCYIPARGTDCTGRSIGSTDGSGTTHFVYGQVMLSNDPSRQFHAVVTVPLDYILSLTITPSSQLQAEWSGIFHITATGNNCCEYGDRIPGMWFAPNSRRLTVADGQPSNGNDYWKANEGQIGDLQPNVAYLVTVECRQTTFTVKINGVEAYSAARVDRSRFPHAHVFAPDPWYDEAYASISNFEMTAV